MTLRYIDGRAQLICDTPMPHARGWAYPRETSALAALEFARNHGWTNHNGRDYCPTCSRRPQP